MRMRFSIAILIAVIGCQKAPRVEPVPQGGGDYSFQMNVGTVPVQGEFSIVADSVMLEAADHGCRPMRLAYSGDPRSRWFSCSGPSEFRVALNLRQPSFSRWTSSQPVKKTRQVCDRWVVTAKGDRVCSYSRTEVYVADEPIGGQLYVTQLASDHRP